MRLDRFIATYSHYSRAEAKRVIRSGQVAVNQHWVTRPEQQVHATDQIKLEGRGLTPLQPRYWMLNKPEGTLCATQDSSQPTVIDLLTEPRANRLQIAGRLDKDTTGLVLITDDGPWNHRVTSPKRCCFKYYRVTLAQPLKAAWVAAFAQGIQLRHETRPTLPAQLTIVDEFTAQLALQEGRYHQVKRMFAALGNRVIALHRYRIGNIHLDANLALGHYRMLTPSEIHSVD